MSHHDQPQTGRIPEINVGTPSAKFIANHNNASQGIESIAIRFHDFENITLPRGQPIASPTFKSLGHEWELKLYPNGTMRSEIGMISLFLHKISVDTIEVTYGLCVRANNGKRKFEKAVNHQSFGFAGRGKDNFAKRSGILYDLTDGALVLEVRLRRAKADGSLLSAGLPAHFVPDNPFPRIALNKFMEEESSDIVFEVVDNGSSEAEDGKESSSGSPKRAKTFTTFHAHSFIIQGWAGVLGDLFKRPTEMSSEETIPIPISDVEPDIFRHLLYYSYGGKVPNEYLKENAKTIIDAADRYGIAGLKMETEAWLVSSTPITIDNAIDNLLYADAKNCPLLKEAVMDYFAENLDECIKKLSFHDAPGHLMKDLMTAMAARSKKQEENNNAKSTADPTIDLSKARVCILRKMLHDKGLDVDGSREMMIGRLEEYNSSQMDDEAPSVLSRRSSVSSA